MVCTSASCGGARDSFMKRSSKSCPGLDIQIFMCQVSSVTLGGAPLSWAPGTLQDSSVLCGWVRGVFVCLCVLFCVLGVVAPSDLVAISLCSHHTPFVAQTDEPTNDHSSVVLR